MKQKDHRALARYLADSVGEDHRISGRWHRRFFVLGCILPDYLPFTYLHGFVQSRAMLGHNTLYSAALIRKRIRRLQKRGIRTLADSFWLGTLMHYLADSFTYPHNERFQGNMSAHRSYEKNLHSHFSRFLSKAKKQTRHPDQSQGALLDILCRSRSEYDRLPPSPDEDSRVILHACREIFTGICFSGALT